MNVEDLQVERFYEPRPEDAVPAEVFEREAEEYEMVGLTELATRARRLSQLKPDVGRLLSAEELAVWAWRYPTAYSTLPKRGFFEFVQRERGWNALTWPVPASVRALIRDVRPSFEGLEIWTPEFGPATRLGPSPILLGRRDNRFYLLARWAEALEPFEEIRARAHSRQGRWAAAVRRRLLQHPLAIYGVPFFISIIAFTFGLPLTVTVMEPPSVPSSHLAIGITLLTIGAAGAILGTYQWCRHATAWARRKACAFAGWVLEESTVW